MWSYTYVVCPANKWVNWGNVFYNTQYTPTVGFPSAITFNTTPFCWYGGRIIGGDAWLCPANGGTFITDTTIGPMYPVRGNKPTGNLTIEPHFLVAGKGSVSI